MELIPLAIAWMLGALAADLAGARPEWTWLLAAGGGALLVAALPLRRRAVIATALACCACALLGAARLCAVQPVPGPQHIVRAADQGEVVVDGWVDGDPKRTEDGQQITLVVEATQTARGARSADGLLLANLAPYPLVEYGQRLRLTGALRAPRGPEHPGDFDYRTYLRRKGILVTMNDPRLRTLAGERGIAPLRALLALRAQSRAVLLQSLPEPQASIAVGVLLGLQSSIPDDVYATFSATGTSHILVVSGWNFTILATVLAALTGRVGLGRAPTLLISLAALWTYALFVGATGTVLRAAVMATLAVVARASDRRGEGWRLLAAACWGLAAYDPNVLWDLGFQLSALATASLFAYGEPVGAWVARVPLLNASWMGWAAEALTATLAAQILALPIILFHFGNLSLIAPLANILLVPVVPYTMLLGTFALVAGLIWLPLGQLAAVLVWGPLAWLTEGARVLAQVPWAAVQLPPFPLSALIAYYGLVVGGWWWVVSAGLLGRSRVDEGDEIAC